MPNTRLQRSSHKGPLCVKLARLAAVVYNGRLDQGGYCAIRSEVLFFVEHHEQRDRATVIAANGEQGQRKTLPHRYKRFVTEITSRVTGRTARGDDNVPWYARKSR